MSEEHDNHFIQSLYRFFGLYGFDLQGDVVVNYTDEQTDGRIFFAVPSLKVGMSTQGDRPGPLLEDGWFIPQMALQHLQVFHSVFNNLKSVEFEARRRRTMNATKNTSQHEQWLIDAVLRRGLPSPDRNHRINKSDGKELTTPDLVWHDIKLAFFVDGVWWHRVMDDKESLEMLRDREGSDNLISERTTRMERDSSIRSSMSADGWTVLTCTDKALETDGGIDDQVNIISRTMKRLRQEKAVLANIKPQTISDDDGPTLEDLLS